MQSIYKGDAFFSGITWKYRKGNHHQLVKTVIFILINSFTTLSVFGQQVPESLEASNSERITIPKLSATITLDGRISEEEWAQARSLPVIQMRPNFGTEPTEETEILIGYDEEYLYAACRCYDTQPVSIASFRRDYTASDTDLFGILLDTFNDNENANIFTTSPAGNRADIAIANDATGDSPLDLDWDTFWNVEVHKNDEGWFAEMRIPVSSLRFDASQNEEVSMGITALRYLSRRNEYIIFPAVSPEWGFSSHLKPSQAQDAVFHDLEPSPPLQVAPYLLGGLGQQHLLNNSQTVYEREDEFTYDAGLDVKYGISSNFTLDLTANTDFAQVEADNQQINLSRFPLFFPEKRKFFQERSSNFAFNFGESNRLFYSRRIGLYQGNQVRILGGARLVGRSGPWDIGVLNMQTAREPNIGQAGNTLSSENFGVLRLRRQVINNYSYVGGIFTSRVGLDGSHNIAYGFDGIFRVGDAQYLSGKWAQTFDDMTSSKLNSLSPSRIQVQWEGRNYEGFGYNLRYNRAGEEYQPGIGFELRENYHRFGDRISYGWITGGEAFLQRHRVNIKGTAHFRNSDGSLQSLLIGPGWQMQTKSNHSLSVNIFQRIEDLQNPFVLSEGIQVPRGRYQFNAAQLAYSMPGAWNLRTSIGVGGGQFFDGNRKYFYVSPIWNASRFIRLNGFYQLNRIKFSQRNEELTNHISRLRIEVTPRVEYAFSSFIQYNSASDDIIGNIRFRYNPKEGNDLYIVYNDQLNTNRAVLSGPDLPFSSNRVILIKYKYTFQW